MFRSFGLLDVVVKCGRSTLASNNMRSALRSPFDEETTIPTRMPRTQVTRVAPTETIRNSPVKEFSIRNWHISSLHTPILSQKRTDEFTEELQVYALPEMLFDSKMTFENTCGFKLEFHALDGLKGARMEHLQEANIELVKVGCAWDNNSNVLTSIQGEQGSKPIEERDDKIDWTFTTLYQGTLLGKDEAVKVELTAEGIDYERLKRRDPILFYDELVLFEDELHDHGTAQLSVKTRVQQEYMYILLRFFLRVDNVLVRIIDTRFYHEYDKNYIIRESSRLESTYEELSVKNPQVIKDPKLMADPNHLLSMLNSKTKQLDKIIVQ